MSLFVLSERPNWSQICQPTSTPVLGLQRRLKLSAVGIGQKWSSGILLASPIASAANQTFASSGPCQVRFLRARRRPGLRSKRRNRQLDARSNEPTHCVDWHALGEFDLEEAQAGQPCGSTQQSMLLRQNVRRIAITSNSKILLDSNIVRHEPWARRQASVRDTQP